MDIGNRIKELRIKMGLTQDQLADKCSLSKNAIWNYENNKRSPSIEILDKIAKALGVTINDLLGIKDITLSKKLINKLEYPLLQMYGIVDTLEILSDKLNINYDTLDNSLNNNIELPIDIQIKLLDLLSKVDYYECINFIDENKYALKQNPDLNNKIQEIFTKKNFQLENNSFEMFKKYLLITFGDKIKEFSNDDDLREIQEETNKYLEFALYKIEKSYYGKDDEDD